MTESSQFIIDNFLDQMQRKQDKIYTHLTTATDTNNVKFIFASVGDMILKEVLKHAGLA